MPAAFVDELSARAFCGLVVLTFMTDRATTAGMGGACQPHEAEGCGVNQDPATVAHTVLTEDSVTVPIHPLRIKPTLSGFQIFLKYRSFSKGESNEADHKPLSNDMIGAT